MNGPVVKAFVLCEAISDYGPNPAQKDLQGAGLSQLPSGGSFPFKRPLFGYAELTDQKARGTLRLALMRADSGRRILFHPIIVEFANPLQATIIAISAHDCVFPAPGVYFVELWYDGDWLFDQRLEVF
jgi:hypothetical protein